MSDRQNGKITALNGLTGIPKSIQCAATQNDQEGGHNEADSIIIHNFLHTLAQVAVNVAQRRLREPRDHDED